MVLSILKIQMTSNKKTKDATFLWFESKIGIGITLTDEGLYFLVCPRFVKYDNLSFTYGPYDMEEVPLVAEQKQLVVSAVQ